VRTDLCAAITGIEDLRALAGVCADDLRLMRRPSTPATEREASLALSLAQYRLNRGLAAMRDAMRVVRWVFKKPALNDSAGDLLFPAAPHNKRVWQRRRQAALRNKEPEEELRQAGLFNAEPEERPRRLAPPLQGGCQSDELVVQEPSPADLTDVPWGSMGRNDAEVLCLPASPCTRVHAGTPFEVLAPGSQFVSPPAGGGSPFALVQPPQVSDLRRTGELEGPMQGANGSPAAAAEGGGTLEERAMRTWQPLLRGYDTSLPCPKSTAVTLVCLLQVDCVVDPESGGLVQGDSA
jgi:hypothetical protein